MLVLQLCLLAVAYAGLFSNSNVIKLTAANFRKEVLANDNVTVVEFYAPWCGHCKTGAADLKKSARSLNGIARVGAVDCDAAENRELCAHYKIEGFPTIKVFQPSKKSDKDFARVHRGEKIKRKAHRVHNYQGPRDSRSINKYAVSKIRNYAATLEGDMSFVWLKANKVPRVVMLPGSKYKSKSIAPLFKVLSNEFFGKMRFAYVPRRADGAWNLIGLQAPEESTIVYLSDDKLPHVYKGQLTKTKVTQFLKEQYDLEMQRRKVADMALKADGVEAAFGLEYVLEDQQTEEMAHVLEADREFEDNWDAYNYYLNSARERKYRSLASVAGTEYTPIESTTVAHSKLTTFHPAEPTVDPDLEHFKQFKPTGKYVDEEPAAAPSADEAEIDDADAGNEDDVEDWTDAMLDEYDIELAPEEILAEGEEAVASWKKVLEEKVASVRDTREKAAKRQEEVNSIRANQIQRKQQAKQAADGTAAEEPSPVQNLPPGITPKPAKEAKVITEESLDDEHYLQTNALKNMDDLLNSCMRLDKICVLMSSDYGFIKDDIRVLLRSRQRFDGRSMEKMVFQFYVDATEQELADASRELGIAPYGGSRVDGEGNERHTPGLAIFDFTAQRYQVCDFEKRGGYNSDNVVQFISDFLRKKKNDSGKLKYPTKFSYWVTQDDVEVIEKLGHANDVLGDDASVHDEL